MLQIVRICQLFHHPVPVNQLLASCLHYVTLSPRERDRESKRERERRERERAQEIERARESERKKERERQTEIQRQKDTCWHCFSFPPKKTKAVFGEQSRGPLLKRTESASVGVLKVISPHNHAKHSTILVQYYYTTATNGQWQIRHCDLPVNLSK